MNYSLIVGNVGETFSGSNGFNARVEYRRAIAQSRADSGRASGESVTLFADGEIVHEYNPGPFWFFEVTDTFGGEANYCWANRYKVSARTQAGALRKLSRAVFNPGRLHCVGDYGDLKRWDVRNACICVFGQYWDDDSHAHYSNVREIL